MPNIPFGLSTFWPAWSAGDAPVRPSAAARLCACVPPGHSMTSGGSDPCE
jgi:hypothetical protein